MRAFVLAPLALLLIACGAESVENAPDWEQEDPFLAAGHWIGPMPDEAMEIRSDGTLTYTLDGESFPGTWLRGEQQWELDLVIAGRSYDAAIRRPELTVFFPERPDEEKDASFMLRSDP